MEFADPYRQLIIKQVEYASAVRCLVAGDDLSNSTKDHLKKHLIDTTNINDQRHENLDEMILNNIAVIKVRVNNLKQDIAESQLQQKRLEEVQKQRYPELHNATVEALLTCLIEIHGATKAEKQNLDQI